jgi:V8-like Glu-specific endopeptidase
MKKTIFSISLLFAMLLSLSTPSYAFPKTANDEDNTVILYDYVTRKETIINLGSTEMQIANFTSAAYDVGESSPNNSIGTQNLTFRDQANPDTNPWNKILLLRMDFDFDHDGTSDSTTYGAGFMVAGDVLLTAGHCVWHTSRLMYATSFRAYRHYSSAADPTIISGFAPSSWIVPEQIRNSNDESYDWAVVKLQNHLQTTGWFGYTDNPNISTKDIAIGGYPDIVGDRHFQFSGFGIANADPPRRLTHDAYSAGGMSGGPIFDSNHVAWGIHTHGGLTLKHGARITTQIVDSINQLINDPVTVLRYDLTQDGIINYDDFDYVEDHLGTVDASVERAKYDFNADGEVDMSDLVTIWAYLLNTPLSYSILSTANPRYDLNDDGVVNTDDTAFFQNYLGYPATSSEAAARCDLFADGIVAIIDKTILLAYLNSLGIA